MLNDPIIHDQVSSTVLQVVLIIQPGDSGEGKMRNTGKLVLMSLKIVLGEKLYALAVAILNVGVLDCQGLLLVQDERVFSSSCV
jgi:hypothetical protein